MFELCNIDDNGIYDFKYFINDYEKKNNDWYIPELSKKEKKILNKTEIIKQKIIKEIKNERRDKTNAYK